MKNHIITGLFTAVLLSACATTRTDTEYAGANSDDRVISISNPQTLADFLVYVPGVFVDDRYGNADVFIRGGRPLYVIDGVRMGHIYVQANNAVSIYDIASVEVLKSPAETMIYGSDGGNGVVLIRTRGGSLSDGERDDDQR